MRIDAVVALFSDVDVPELRLWIERGWVIPDSKGEDWDFGEIDVARIRLLRTLRRDVEVGEDSMAIVLSLLDQLYDARATLRRVLQAIERQPGEVRALLAEALGGRRD